MEATDGALISSSPSPEHLANEVFAVIRPERTWVFLYLLKPAGAGALYGYHCCLTWEQIFVLQILQGQSLRTVDHATDLQRIVVLVYDRNAAVVADKMVLISGERRLDKAILGLPVRKSSDVYRGAIADPWRLAVVGKVQHMYHILCLLFLDDIPALLREALESRAQRCMVLLPPHAFDSWVRVRYGHQLKLRLLGRSKLH